ncbi:alpha-L-fucosidase [Rhodopirellula sp. SWK7]|uniref:alpha-L-fucosidase n=1 Tax=Rhodopirellula sp. SWK7 TaxID=595460 RepID=UPI0002BE6766|nr:alpha-L-fucosidase [Rhodopirellula sp. SWK7]EMI43301.1 Glycoside hydrolase, family 29 [Rhodopirellula sp. SWK7]
MHIPSTPSHSKTFPAFTSVMAMTCLIASFTLLFVNVSLADGKISQRVDGCVVMNASQAHTNESRLEWEFELKHPGTFTVQVVSSIHVSDVESPVTVELDNQTLRHDWKKVYLIEDGLVWEHDQSLELTPTRRHTISIADGDSIESIRLVPTGYVQSKILISSESYFDDWIQMHQSPEKQAALAWLKEARFGMFIHWGVYSEAAGSWKNTRIEKGQGPKVAEWIMNAFKIPRKEYRAFAERFNPAPSFAVNIARLAKDTGMRYLVITAKHHDGFALFDSAHSEFDITDSTLYDGDLIKELYDACRAEGIEFGIYYSHGNDWNEGGDGNYANVKARNDRIGVPTKEQGKNLWDPSPNTHADYLNDKAYPQITELIKRLPELRIIWFDGEGLITEKQAFEFYRLVYQLNPSILVNRRIGYDFGDYVDAGDNKTPTENQLAAKHFETCGTANHSWGFKAHDHHWKSSNELLRNFVDIVSKGGNYLLNIGPDGKGRVPEPCVKSFEKMGEWVKTNSDAIFGTQRWTTFSEGVDRVKNSPSKPTEFWFSAKDAKVYAMSLVPGESVVRVLSLNQSTGRITQLRLLGSDQELKWTQTNQALEIDFTGVETSENGYAIEAVLEDD